MTSEGRRARVAQSIRAGLAELVRREVRDPRVSEVGLLSVNHVELNVDMSVARVYVSVVGGDEEAISAAVTALRRAAGALRGPLGRHLRLKRAPELRFYPDPGAEMGARIADIVREDEARHDPEDS